MSSGNTAPPLDPITIELIRNVFNATCNEMAESLIRSSHSPNIKERRDCSCSLYDVAGEMAVQAEHIPTHLGVMPQALRVILTDFPVSKIAPGDSFLVNDPYFGGNHLPDFIVAGPLYLEGRLIGFAASMAHHTDVGGLTPRSMPAKATEIFQEGLRLPPVQLGRDGKLDPSIARIITANSRLPEERLADLAAQMATIRVAQNRIDELGRRYSADQIVAATRYLINASEAATRDCIRALPETRWTGTSFADFGGELVLLKVTIHKDGDDLIVDFTGTGPQTKSPFNSCLANTLACVYMALKVTIAEGIPPNGGMYRVLKVKAPEGSILNPSYPAAVSAATQVSYHTFEALMQALLPLISSKALADTGAGGVFSFGGVDPRTGRLFAYGEALGGGSGASAVADGESGMIPPIANLHDTPVEALEMQLPIRIERYELVEGSGGDGRMRGGLGLRRVFRMLTDVKCSYQISMPFKGPSGLDGGGAARPTHATVHHVDGSNEQITAFSEFAVEAGGSMVIESAGGGGYGSSKMRDPAARRADKDGGYLGTGPRIDAAI